MDPDTYVAGQCADALRGVEGKAKVYMGIGVDAPRSRPDTAKMTKDIAYRSVMATYRAGGHGSCSRAQLRLDAPHPPRRRGRGADGTGSQVTLDLAIRGGLVLTPDGLRPGTVAVAGGRIVAILRRGRNRKRGRRWRPAATISFPCDRHSHPHPQPRLPERGSVESETGAAAKGGITTLFEMPITDPCCNSPERVALRRDHFAAHALTDFALFAAPVE